MGAQSQSYNLTPEAMNTAIILHLIVLLTFTQDPTRQVQTSPEHVEVYRDGAQLSHGFEVILSSGINEFTITGLPGVIDEQSIQLSVDRNLTLLSITPEVDFLLPPHISRRTDSLTAARDNVVQSIGRENARLSVLASQKELLKANQGVDGGGSIEELERRLKFYRETLLKITGEELAVQENIKKLEAEKANLDRQIRGLSGGARQRQYKVHVSVDAPQAGRTRFNLTYLTSAASWYPSYDVRFADITSPLKLTYTANITQQTGLDWEDVMLTISSATPQRGNLRPVIRPEIIDFAERIRRDTAPPRRVLDTSQLPTAGQLGITAVSGYVRDAATGEALPGTIIHSPESNVGTSTDANGFFRLDIPSNTKSLQIRFVGYEMVHVPIERRQMEIGLRTSRFELNEVVVTGSPGAATSVVLRGTSSLDLDARLDMEAPETVTSEVTEQELNFSYKISTPYSIPTGGRPVTVRFHEEMAQAEYRYISVPKLDGRVFLVAEIADWDSMNLLAGMANVFMENNYTGRTHIVPGAFDEPMSIALGNDARIVIEREPLPGGRSRNFFGNRVRETHAWEITIRNTRNSAVDVIIEDQVPLSGDSSINISVQGRSGAEHDQDTGKLIWNLSLEPNETRTLVFEYRIEYPSGRRIVRW